MEKERDIIQSFIKLGCKCSNNGYHLYDIQKWLREVKFINIWFHDWVNDFYGFEITDKSGTFYTCTEPFETYEEALEAGIWESYFILNN